MIDQGGDVVLECEDIHTPLSIDLYDNRNITT